MPDVPRCGGPEEWQHNPTTASSCLTTSLVASRLSKSRDYCLVSAFPLLPSPLQELLTWPPHSRLVVSNCLQLAFELLLFSWSVVSDSVTPWTVAGQTVFHCLPEFAQTHVHWVDDAIQPSPLLLLPSLALILTHVRVFSNELALPIRWPKDCSFSFSISPFYGVFRVYFL